MSSYIKILPGHVDKKIASAQNKTSKYVWQKIRKTGAFYLADTVGAGKSFIALSLALGKWRIKRRKGQSVYRILVISPTNELCHSWLSKLGGHYQSTKDHIGDLAILPQEGSFFSYYMSEEFKNPNIEMVVYHFRGRHDVSRLTDEINPKSIFTPKASSTKPRLEILVTTPNWLTKGIHGPHDNRRRNTRLPWLNWVDSCDVIIADEVFSARREGTLYGDLLRPNIGEYAFWNSKDRPWLIGLSATMLSRDITDVRELLQIAWGWQHPKYDFETPCYGDLTTKLNEFQNTLKDGLSSSEKDSKKISSEYRLKKANLENLLRQVIVRTQPIPKRKYEFSSAGSSKITSATPSKTFPIERGLTPTLKELSSERHEDELAVKNLANFFQSALSTKAKTFDAKEISVTDTWTQIQESGGKDFGPKHASLQLWLASHYKKAEDEWLDPMKSEEFRFKVLVYLKHVKSARAFKFKKGETAEGISSFGTDLYKWLRARMLQTCRELAKLNPEIFIKGNIDTPTEELVNELQSAGFKDSEKPIAILKKPANLTLLLASLIHANKGKSPSDKIRRFTKTIQGHLLQSEKHPYIWLLSRNIEQRNLILQDLNASDLAKIDGNKQNKKSKLPSLGLYLLNIDHIDIPDNEKRVFLEKANNLAGEIFRLSGVNARIKERAILKKKWIELHDHIVTNIESHETWQNKVNEIKGRGINFAIKLKARSKAISGHHNAPSEIEFLTGTGSNISRRNFVTQRFLTPSNPCILVLTNICTVGVDLHKYCWDVVHFTPSWTPHELEQKIGRIDRPRVGIEETFDIAKSKESIRVHHLIWPNTYDERMLSRVHLRSQFSERLLGSRSQNALESKFQNDGNDKFSVFRPLDLNPK